ncbi:hypothetical protein VSDG_06627 [Cytospora chrysosperma]|uniref:Copper homeostasis protein cutC homolog n=1 Tax=Cytospora chrysosperma TaxID=252740 RepID=A0A423VP64_CYTCH|nr:hypothetical protein VSDG_06627 [Valsa sordida]
MTTTTTTAMTITGLEVPVFSPASAMAALSRGASRLEVNRAGSYPQGGTTPDEAEVAPLSGSPAPLRIMIRPRGPPTVGGGGGAGPDFVYSGAELDDMRDAIRRFKACGHLRAERGDGFVFGVLMEEKEEEEEEGRAALAVDVDANSELVQLARPFPCVFHRAFDDVLGSSSSSSSNTVERALRAVAACGFDGVLTSGGPGRAADNAEALSLVLRRAVPAGLEVIVGGGVRSSNARALRGALLCGGGGGGAVPGGARVWLHSSCLTARSGGEVDEEEVARIVSVLGEGALEA